jgi:hypothetical protein
MRLDRESVGEGGSSASGLKSRFWDARDGVASHENGLDSALRNPPIRPREDSEPERGRSLVDMEDDNPRLATAPEEIAVGRSPLIEPPPLARERVYG